MPAGGCELERMLLELGTPHLEKVQGDPCFCHSCHHLEGLQVTRGDGACCSEVRSDKIRGGRHKLDMGYAMGWGEPTTIPELLPEETWESPSERFPRTGFISTSARNSSSIVLALKQGARRRLFPVLLFP